MLLERGDPHPSHFFCGCDKIPRQKQLKGEGFILAQNPKVHHHGGEAKEQKHEASGHNTLHQEQREMDAVPMFSSLSPF